ncbi:MAG: enoyl-CoA hydratase/isomerase family protein [Alphaproteobacteria bacterium]|nr:enoyl-CoA hydratase/isomerase family protein [Alphaproteobacteria bacterium]
MENNNILISTDGPIGIITLNRLEQMNAINASMLENIHLQLQTWSTDNKIKAVLLQGNEKFFASGIDLKELVAEANQIDSKIDEMQKNIESIANFSKPIIACVSGLAVGIGFELALACDFILAADNVLFACPETSLSFIPSFGGIQRLVRTIGKAQASEIILTGRALKADDALTSGVVSRVVPSHALYEDALKTAKKIASHSEKTTHIAKQNIKLAFNNLDNAIYAEKLSAKICFSDSEFKQSLIDLQNKSKKQ